ncbi:nucleoside triphosphate hydrolase [Marinomonas mediterranea]|uniref:nucleoside triphosphate hydrolase n=1 Tax=Marinomonas mediterranea TaxID=119864 RepID=UPI00234B7C84|nr:nucleoside triphosphate hydrolase [Marinomonas mediterranea]WCN11066.1 nucleoside/nucleotide kinase family protein [Marinomonas mediterranea]
MTSTTPISVKELAELLIKKGKDTRIVVALVGAPGSGKSLLADRLQTAINSSKMTVSAILPMDGFHYDNLILDQKGLLSRKGAPETFDVSGLKTTIKRLRDNTETEIAVPVFDRSLEIARSGARLIPNHINVLIVEGNYLLLNRAPWNSLASLFDYTVSIDVTEEELRRRLIQRWHNLGLEPKEGEAKVETNDLPNGRTVLTCSVPSNFLIENNWSNQ